jgi:carbon-monoxide dehydrogenase large subunit
MERLIDEAAATIGIDPLDLRLRNLLEPRELPCKTPTGNTLDSGRYSEAVEHLKKAADYPALIANRDRRRAEGELSGVGVAFYIEPCGVGWETARVTMNPDGTVLAATGGSTQGHGRETTLAQIVADRLVVAMDAISVVHGDTETCPAGIGALASRSTAIGGSAMMSACDELLIMLQDAGDIREPITAEVKYENDGEAWGYGCYIVCLSVDASTGVPTIDSAFCVDDVGMIVNSMIVDGQIMGGFAQGVGEALLEQVIYDDDGQLLTGSFTDYALPRADDVPDLLISKLSTPSPFNALGAKGVGEAGTIGAPAAILNAAIDALRPLGVSELQMPLTSEKLWRAIRDAKKGQTK